MQPMFWPFMFAPTRPPVADTRQRRLKDLEDRMSTFLTTKRTSACETVLDQVEASRAELRKARSASV